MSMFKNFLYYKAVTGEDFSRDTSVLLASTLADADDIIQSNDLDDSEKMILLEKLMLHTKVILSVHR